MVSVHLLGDWKDVPSLTEKGTAWKEKRVDFRPGTEFIFECNQV